jgi:hypothetical protein
MSKRRLFAAICLLLSEFVLYAFIWQSARTHIFGASECFALASAGIGFSRKIWLWVLNGPRPPSDGPASRGSTPSPAESPLPASGRLRRALTYLPGPLLLVLALVHAGPFRSPRA